VNLKVSWRTHRKRAKLQARLGADAVVALQDLWLACKEAKNGGSLLGLDAEDVAIAARYCGDPGLFVATLVELNLLEGGPGSYRIHDYLDHNPDDRGAMPVEARSRLASAAVLVRWHRAGKHALLPADGCPLCAPGAGLESETQGRVFVPDSVYETAPPVYETRTSVSDSYTKTSIPYCAPIRSDPKSDFEMTDQPTHDVTTNPDINSDAGEVCSVQGIVSLVVARGWPPPREAWLEQLTDLSLARPFDVPEVLGAIEWAAHQCRDRDEVPNGGFVASILVRRRRTAPRAVGLEQAMAKPRPAPKPKTHDVLRADGSEPGSSAADVESARLNLEAIRRKLGAR
jgi:hypothetical protein